MILGCRPGKLLGLALLAAATLAHADTWQIQIEAQRAFAQAHQALLSGHDDQAELWLERVLMLRPEHAEARLELAQLLRRLGRRETAALLLQSLIDDPRSSAAQRAGLARWQAELYPFMLPSARPDAPPPPSGARYRAEISLGAASNPLARSAASEVTLSLPDGAMVLPLSTPGAGGTLIGAALSCSAAQQGFDLSLQQSSLAASQSAARALLWGKLAWPQQFGAQWLVAAQQDLEGTRRYSAGLALPLGVQRLSLALYTEPTQADRGALLRYERQAHGVLGADWLASLERSASSAKAQAYWRAGLAAELTLAPARHLQLQWSFQQDSYGYSALLENHAKRQLLTAYVAIEQQVLLVADQHLVWRAYTGARRSNLALFAYHDFGLQLAWQYAWR